MTQDEQPWRAAEGGAAAVEAALVMSVLLLAMIGIVEFARAFWTYNAMLLAVEEAGRYAMVYGRAPSVTCGAQAQAPNCPALSSTPLANCTASRAQQVLSAYQVAEVDVSVREDTTSSPATITVCASYTFAFTGQLIPYGPLYLSSEVTVPLL